MSTNIDHSLDAEYERLGRESARLGVGQEEAIMVSLTPSERELVRRAQEAARSGYPGCYRTPNLRPAEEDWHIGGDVEVRTDWPPVKLTTPSTEYVRLYPKPARPGYYWYQEGQGARWRVVEVVTGATWCRLFFLRVWPLDQSCEAVMIDVVDAGGEWGPEIVHG